MALHSSDTTQQSNTHPPTVDNPSPEQKRFNPQHLQKLSATLNPHPIAPTKYNRSKIHHQTHRSTNLGPKIHYQPTGPPKSTIKPTHKPTGSPKSTIKPTHKPPVHQNPPANPKPTIKPTRYTNPPATQTHQFETQNPPSNPR